jgi:AcrR family transcriptional regulator
MKNDLEKTWIEAGYEIFSNEGINGLKIEKIARQVGKNKSSFYHLFSDIDIFQEKLLDYHIQRAKLIAIDASNCKSVEPDLLNLFIDIKQDLLFNKQLRVGRENLAFEKCFKKANELVEEKFFDIWLKTLGLENQPDIARNFLTLTSENFYLQITKENLNKDWLLQYLNQLIKFVKDIHTKK